MNNKNKDTAEVNDLARANFLAYLARLVTEYKPSNPRNFYDNLLEFIEASKNFDEQMRKVTSDPDNFASFGQMETLFLELRKKHDDTVNKLFLAKSRELNKK
ncbi:MAG: hypothetical protein LBT38_00345 [Deltaproteobacteria bacterium]|nr:hypothetical protein [Deltaproteobacteria bacterium]